MNATVCETGSRPNLAIYALHMDQYGKTWGEWNNPWTQGHIRKGVGILLNEPGALTLHNSNNCYSFSMKYELLLTELAALNKIENIASICFSKHFLIYNTSGSRANPV